MTSDMEAFQQAKAEAKEEAHRQAVPNLERNQNLKGLLEEIKQKKKEIKEHEFDFLPQTKTRNRTALLDDIRTGKTQKAPETGKKKPALKNRTDMMQDIRAKKELKSTKQPMKNRTGMLQEIRSHKKPETEQKHAKAPKDRSALLSEIRSTKIVEKEPLKKQPQDLLKEIQKKPMEAQTKKAKVEHQLPPKSRADLLSDIRSSKGRVVTKEKQKQKKIIEDIQFKKVPLKKAQTRNRGDVLSEIRTFKESTLKKSKKPMSRTELMQQIRSIEPKEESVILKQSPELLEAIKMEHTLKKTNYAPKNRSQLMQEIRTVGGEAEGEIHRFEGETTKPRSRQELMTEIRSSQKKEAKPAKKPKSRTELLSDIRTFKKDVPSRHRAQPEDLLISIREAKYRQQLKHTDEPQSKKDLSNFLN